VSARDCPLCCFWHGSGTAMSRVVSDDLTIYSVAGGGAVAEGFCPLGEGGGGGCGRQAVIWLLHFDAARALSPRCHAASGLSYSLLADRRRITYVGSEPSRVSTSSVLLASISK
jgi:hypothetical protein